MPVATQAAVKLLTPEDLQGAGTSIVVANAYHLYLRPGVEVVAAFGGLHRFMSWPHAILTDSGGFQIHSLAPLREVDDDGVTFRSHVDGQLLRFTPEIATEVQRGLGADLIMAFDYCASYPASRQEAEKAVALTAAWAARCSAAHDSPSQKLLGIVQGGVFKDLRERSAAHLVEMDFFGYAVGGLSVGEQPDQTAEYAAFTAALLPENKVRYLMGVGRPEDIARAVASGVDMFDCVVPTREGRHGTALTARGRINLRQSPYRNDERPLDEECGCYTCRRFSRAYLRHLFLAGEHLAARLVSVHNLYYLHDFVGRLRAKIISEKN